MKIKIVAPIQHFYIWNESQGNFPDIVDIEDNLTLTKFDNSHVDLAANFFTDLYSGWQKRELKNCKYCLIYEKKSTNFQKDKEIGLKKVYHFVESLKIVRPNETTTLGLIFKQESDDEWIPQAASHWSNTVYRAAGWKPKDIFFRSEDIESIIKYYYAIDQLYSKYGGKYHRLLNSFIFFQLAFQIRNPKLRVVPFTTALESLFNTSENEISYSLRMRCAAFLEDDLSEREKILEKIKLIYSARSAAVHGSSFPKKLLKNEKMANQLMMDVEEICRRCYQKIISDEIIEVFEKNNKKLSKRLDEPLLK